MVNSRKPVLGSMKSQSSNKAKSRKLAKRTRQFETLERRQLMAMDFSPSVQAALGTMLFTDQASYNAVGQQLQAKFGRQTSSSQGGGEDGAPFNTVEIEPNNTQATASHLPLGNISGKNPVVNVSGQMQNIFDIDYYAFDLRKGDILDLRSQVGTGRSLTGLTLFNAAGLELLYSKSPFYTIPAGRPTAGKSPRFQTADASLTYTIDTDGRYFLSVSDGIGAYTLNLRTYRPTFEAEPIGTKQILYLDFDGSFIRNDLFSLDVISGTPARTQRVPSMDRILPTIGLTTADGPALVRDISRRVEQKLRTQLARDTNNGFYAQTGNPGDFDIQIINSADSPDIFGQPNVSRIVIGGGNADFGVPPAIGLLGIAQEVDIGNFDHEDTGLVMVDILAQLARVFPLAGNFSIANAFAEFTAFVIAHEAGHNLGGIHQDPSSPINTIMDAFFDPTVSAGRDGLIGNADDEPLRFINDDFRPGETDFGGGVNNSGQALAFGMSTGKVGLSIIGNAYNDVNRNAIKDTGDAGIGGWEIFADINNNGAREQGEPRTTTDNAGNYNLRVAPGTYTVRIIRPAPWIASRSSEEAKTVSVLGSSTATANFGSVIPSDVATGFKWLDLNADGIRDASEPALAGVYIYLDLDGDDRPDIGEPASISKADGSYNLVPPGPGTYAIREVVAAGFVQTFPASGEHTVTYDGRNPLRGYNFGNNESSDWGDAPAPYPTTRAQNGASNGTTPGLRLGDAFDADQDGRPSANADGDDVNGLLSGAGTVIDDEDGVGLLTPIVRGDRSNIIRVNVTNTAGSPAYLQGWIDFNGNGSWSDPGEQIATNVVFTASGASNLTFTTPSNAVGRTFARFRLSQDQNLLPTGRSTTGEVEDYVYNIVDGPRVLLQPDSFTVARNSQNNVLDVLANDFKLPNDTFRLSTVSSGSQGGRTTIDQATQTVRYTPQLSFTGRDTFTYTAVSASGIRETATVTVNVALQFVDPVAVDDSFDVPTNSIGFPLSVLANDVEGRGGSLIVQSVSTPDKGGSVVIGSGSQSIRYTPRRDFGGTEQFTYTAVDGTGKVSTANITVHTVQGDRLDDEVEFSFSFLNAVNEPITEVRQGDSFKVVVFVDDLRPEKAALEVPPRNITDPGVYSAYLDLLYTSGLVTPNAPTSGTQDFAATFLAPYQTGRGGSALTPGIIDELGAFIGQVTTFNQPGRLPVVILDFTAISAGIAEFVGDPADRIPGSEVTFYNAPASARVANEQIRFGRSTIEIVPNGVNFPFAVDDTRFNVPQGNPFNVDVLTNDTVGTQPPIRITSVTQPGSGQTLINDNNTPNNFSDDTVTYIPNTNFVGLDQFKYTITDERGFISTATVTMHVGVSTADDVIQLRLSATDLAGVPIDQIIVGQQFQLRGYVEDLRTSASQFGVFAAFQDILYNKNLVSVNPRSQAPRPGDIPLPDFQVDFATNFRTAPSGDIRIPGLINEIGSAQTGNSPTGLGEKLQFTITLTARNTGTATFIGDPADIKPFHDSFVFDPTTPLLPSQIRYLSDTLLIVSTSGGTGSSGGEGNTNLTNAFDVNNDGFVSPIDVLILVNSLNNGGSGLMTAGSNPGNGEGGSGRYFLDVDRDSYLSPLDALMVINEINNRQNGGSGEGEASAAPMASTFKTQLVEVPFATKRSSVSPAFVYGPLPTTREVEEAFSLDEYLAQQSISEEELDYLDGLAADVLKSSLS